MSQSHPGARRRRRVVARAGTRGETGRKGGAGHATPDRGPARVRVWKRKRRRSRRWLQGIAILLAAVGLLAVVEALRLAPALDDLRRGEAALRDAGNTLGVNPQQWTPRRVDAAMALQREAQGLLSRGQDQVTSDPLLALAAHLPFLGDQVVAAGDLGRGGLAGSRAVSDFGAVARAYEAAASDTAPPGPRLLRLISASAGPLGDAHDHLAPPIASLRTDQDRILVGPLRGQVDEALQQLAPLDGEADAGAAAGRYAPAALGADGPRTYLVLLLNPSELRPAGGFAGAVGTVVFKDGAPTEVALDAQEALNTQIKDTFAVPAPLGRYLSFYRNSLEVGDAGWDPDFPTTARLNEAMFRSATGRAVDGTIAIDPYAVQSLLAVTGPVTVPGYGSFNSADFFNRLDLIVNAGVGPRAGKQALGPISTAVLRSVLAQPVGNWPRLLGAFQDQAHRRHVQVYMHQAELARAAANARYDGAVLQDLADYLMVVDANVGQTKGDRFVTKSLSFSSDIATAGTVQHRLVLDYTMPPPADAIDRALNPFDGSYKDYVRVYVPATAALQQATVTMDGAAAEGGLQAIGFEHGWQVFSIYFRLPRGHAERVAIDYRVTLPADNSYRLFVQKQAGSPGKAATLTVGYPGGKVDRHSSLTSDEDLSVRW